VLLQIFQGEAATAPADNGLSGEHRRLRHVELTEDMYFFHGSGTI